MSPGDTQVPGTFEEALKELEKTIGALEGGDQSLQQTIGLYEQGTRLLKQCHSWLASTEKRIEQITRQADGSIETADWDPGAPAPDVMAQNENSARSVRPERSAKALSKAKEERDISTDADTSEGELPF